MIARDKLKYFHIIMVILVCVGLMPAQAECATVRTTMHVSAITIPSGILTNLVWIDDPEAGENSDDPTRYLPSTAAGWGTSESANLFKRKLLQQVMQLPQDFPYTLSFEGEQSHGLRLIIQGGEVLIVDASKGGFKDRGEDAVFIISLLY